jgi:ABC-type sugar transport system substrate-binding protein
LIAVTIKVHQAWTEALKKLAAQGVPVVVALANYRPSEKWCRSVDDVEGFLKSTPSEVSR